ncbi:MAG TPA: 2Fe-2S iron-sulfur cluster-binding protein [Ensifer sp.]|nr:2Fe-2S iron-sulfur cluster-binding protein [Ensifer sp.]
MITIVFRQFDGQEMRASGRKGDTVMQVAVANGVPGVIGECGGSLACATCHCYVADGSSDLLQVPGAVEDEMLNCTTAERRPESRLTCQLTLCEAMDGMIFNVPEETY